MAQQIRQITASIPANTAKASPVTVALAVGVFSVESVDLEVPPGPQGLMGFYLAFNGQQLIPFEAGEYIVWDNRYASWPLSDFPETGAWQLVGYNTDTANAHKIITRWHVNSIGESVNPTPSLTIVSTPVDSSVGVLL